MRRAEVGFYFALWYALNIVYNSTSWMGRRRGFRISFSASSSHGVFLRFCASPVVNKQVLNAWPAPLTVGTLQLAVGAAYTASAYSTGLRRRPALSRGDHRTLRRIGVWHALGHLTTTMSLGAGPVSFTHIVKALEPLFSAVLSALLLGQYLPVPVYVTLLPVVGGVGYACLKERAFSWFAFAMAMMANVSFALRAIWSKTTMTSSASSSSQLTPLNTYALVTMAGLWTSIPLALLGEGRQILSSLQSALQQQSAGILVRGVFLSGLYLHLCNEVMFLALGAVHPITLAVGNTIKRVFVMLASILVFRNVVTAQAAVGSTIGIGGVLLYSITKQHYEK